VEMGVTTPEGVGEGEEARGVAERDGRFREEFEQVGCRCSCHRQWLRPLVGEPPITEVGRKERRRYLDMRCISSLEADFHAICRQEQGEKVLASEGRSCENRMDVWTKKQWEKECSVISMELSF
jgi:hypothetical protein